MQNVMSSMQAEAEKQPLNMLPSNTVHSKKHKILIIYTIKSMTMTYIYIYTHTHTYICVQDI